MPKLNNKLLKYLEEENLQYKELFDTFQEKLTNNNNRIKDLDITIKELRSENEELYSDLNKAWDISSTLTETLKKKKEIINTMFDCIRSKNHEIRDHDNDHDNIVNSLISDINFYTKTNTDNVNEVIRLKLKINNLQELINTWITK